MEEDCVAGAEEGWNPPRAMRHNARGGSILRHRAVAKMHEFVINELHREMDERGSFPHYRHGRQ